MAEYVIIGGSRKNPAIEKMNYPHVPAQEKARLLLAEMKATVIDTGAAGKSAGAGSKSGGGGSYRQFAVPDIPLTFFKGRE